MSPLRTRASIVLALLVAVNGLAWLLAWSSSRLHFLLLGAAWLAYGFGLRHAVDADHISAIDNTTRRLLQRGKRPLGVGFYFSLGHSTIVILLCAGLAFATAYVQHHLPQWQSIGGIVGTIISTVFLYLIGGINLYVLWDLVRAYRRKDSQPIRAADEDNQGPQGPLAHILRPLLRMVEHSWQMYFVGLLFGLGFDTATEVGILALSAKSGQAGIPFWAIMLLPLLFTAGMCLIDTLDGILMLRAYGWAFLEPSRKLGYNIVITAISVGVAFIVGTDEMLGILTDQHWLRGRLADWINGLSFDNVGFGIVALFVLVWAISVFWNRQSNRVEETA
jgi:high-affinity nickel-transport protein